MPRAEWRSSEIASVGLPLAGARLWVKAEAERKPS